MRDLARGPHITERSMTQIPQRQTSRTRITSASASHVGLKRPSNEDALIENPELGLYAVLDGMGGARAGEVAAQIARDVLVRHVQRPRRSTDHAGQVLVSAIGGASEAVFRAAQEQDGRRGMGTTVVACLLQGAAPIAHIAHVGDSRAYLSRDGALYPLTKDHSVVQGLIDRGHLQEAEAQHHHLRNLLARSVGTDRVAHADLTSCELRAGDRLLLCSDGLHGYAAREAIRTVVAQPGPVVQVAADLIGLALHGGGGDNVSVVVIDAS